MCALQGSPRRAAACSLAARLSSARSPSPFGSLANLQSACVAALATARMPTTRNEEYRFTDVSPVLQLSLTPAGGAADGVAATVAAHGLQRAAAATVVVVDGVIDAQHSSMGGLPAGVYVGGMAGAPQDVVSFALVRRGGGLAFWWAGLAAGGRCTAHRESSNTDAVAARTPPPRPVVPPLRLSLQGAQSRSRGGAFALLNGAAARDVVVVHVPASTVLQAPIHVLHLSSGAGAAAPRLLAVLEEGATAEVVEEFGGLGSSGDGAPRGAAAGSLTTAVAEIELDDGAALKHSYVQLEGRGVAHWKATLVNQGRESSYSLTEVGRGLPSACWQGS